MAHAFGVRENARDRSNSSSSKRQQNEEDIEVSSQIRYYKTFNKKEVHFFFF